MHLYRRCCTFRVEKKETVHSIPNKKPENALIWTTLLLFNKSIEYQGEVAERFNALVLKTNVASQSPRVRIPLSPFIFFFLIFLSVFQFVLFPFAMHLGASSFFFHKKVQNEMHLASKAGQGAKESVTKGLNR